MDIEEEEIDIFVLDENDRKFMIEIPPNIKYIDLVKKIERIFKRKNFNVRFISKLYTLENDKDETLNFEESDMIYLLRKEINENKNENENENKNECEKENKNENKINREEFMNKLIKENLTNLSGILKIFFLKYIQTYLKDDININANYSIKSIFLDLENYFELEVSPSENKNLKIKNRNDINIRTFSDYIDLMVNENNLIDIIIQLDKSKEDEIISLWKNLKEYKYFEDFINNKYIEKSYFDYSLNEITLFDLKNQTNYKYKFFHCPNGYSKLLFYEEQNGKISNELNYYRKPLLGTGIYFTDNLDYISFYTKSKNTGKTLPVNSNFSFIGSIIYYDKKKENRIFDYYTDKVNEIRDTSLYVEIKENYPDKIVPKNGINVAYIDVNDNRIINQNEIIQEKRKGKFVANEFVITEKEQILPSFGIEMKRNEYFVIWRDSNFGDDNNIIPKEMKEKIISKFSFINMNIYLESKIEKALELIKRKKYNKIILVSDLGLDSSGIKFVEIARKILGFNATILFYSENTEYLRWIQNFPNALYTNNITFLEKYIMNYNEKGLIELKQELENMYNVIFNFEANFLQFPKFINEVEYKNINFNENCENFKKVLIKSVEDNNFLINNNNQIYFTNEEQNLLIWYITILNNEITFYSNGSYLHYDIFSKNIFGNKYMKIWNYQKTGDNFIIYDRTAVNTLTKNYNKLIAEKLNGKSSQLFELIEVI